MEKYCGNSVVSKLLSESNYEEWSFQVKHYLSARDLWDVVAKSGGARRPKGDDQKFKLKAWKRKNAAALHAILISCSSSSLPVIKDIKSARKAWITLAHEYERRKSQPEHEVIENEPVVENETNTVPDQRQGLAAGNNEQSQMPANPNVVFEFQRYEPFFKAVYRGHWDTAKLFLDQHPEAVRVRIPGLGKNALHVAVTEEHLQVVEGLSGRMTEQDVEMQRNDGFTVLAAAIEVGNLAIAKCLIGKNKRLISFIQQAYGLPVVHAVVSGQKHMVHYLYAATPVDDLILPDEGRRGASLLSQCIFVQHFGNIIPSLPRKMIE